jgi:hypothetical protein
MHLQTLLLGISQSWGIEFDQTMMNALIAHIEQQITTDSATVIADCAADLAIWKEPSKGPHT